MHEIINSSEPDTDGGRLAGFGQEKMSDLACERIQKEMNNRHINRRNFSRQISKSLDDGVNQDAANDCLLTSYKPTSRLLHTRPPSGQDTKSSTTSHKPHGCIKGSPQHRQRVIENKRIAYLQGESSLYGKDDVYSNSISVRDCVSPRILSRHLNQQRSNSSSEIQSVNTRNVTAKENIVLRDQEINKVGTINIYFISEHDFGLPRPVIFRVLDTNFIDKFEGM